MINSRKIEDLLPIVQTMCREFVEKCDKAGIDVIITSTYRDAESQAVLYARGRENSKIFAKNSRIVTNAKPGQSYHNWRVAFDFVPIVNGKAVWNDTALFTQCGKIAESVGLEWAGRWTRFREMAHCQFTGGLKISDFQNGKTIR